MLSIYSILFVLILTSSNATVQTLSSNFDNFESVYHEGNVLSVVFEDHKYTLHDVDSDGKYYYVEKGWHLHRFYPETKKWEKNLFNASSLIMTVHVTVNNYIFVGVRSGEIYRSSDGGNSFSIIYEWQKGGHCHTWSIASDEKWILIGEYGMKVMPRRVIASNSWGDHWEIVYETPEPEGVHIHRVTIDPYTHDWWVTVGDYPAGRVMYSKDNGNNWDEVECPETGRNLKIYQPCNILFFEFSILIINEPFPQVFKVDRKTMTPEYITDIVDFPHYDFAAPYSVVVGHYGIYASIIRHQEDLHSASIFVSYDQGFTWRQLINFTSWAAQEDPTIAPSNVYGANPIIYADGSVHATWISYPWVGTYENFVLEGGRAIKLKDANYTPGIESTDGSEETITTPMTSDNITEVNTSSITTPGIKETITTYLETSSTKEVVFPEFSLVFILQVIIVLSFIAALPMRRKF